MDFSNSGDLFVGCANHFDVTTGIVATTDIVAFPTASLANMSETVDASTLSPVRITVDEVTHGGFLAVKQITIDGLTEIVLGLGLSQGIERSLVATFEAAKRALDSGNPSAAVGALIAFTSQVSALIANGTLSGEAGQSLLDAANAIIDQILTS